MNYITKLKTENAELTEKLAKLETAFTDFSAFLLSPKFQGQESAGERKNWISTDDVQRWISEIKSSLF